MVEKKILIKYTLAQINESKDTLFPCPVYLNLDGAIKFVDTINFHRDKLISLLNERKISGPVVLNYDEVMK